jgi:hypothetical protein
VALTLPLRGDMAIALNRTIVPARDKETAARQFVQPPSASPTSVSANISRR